jgi:pimeloyl-ACP methyl ester carboxylesterase
MRCGCRKTIAALCYALLIVSAAIPVRGEAQHRASATSEDGLTIAYEVTGEGVPAIVLVHGWSCDRTYWKEQIDFLARHHRVVAIDVAGHGESGVDRKAWTMQAFGGDVAAVVRQLQLERVILVGHSMGGDVIVEAARRLPGRVAGLVWVDTYRRLDAPRTDAEVDALMAPFRANFVATTRSFVQGMFLPNADRALVERVSLDMSSAPAPIALGAMKAALSFDREIPAALRELRLPVVAINADDRPTDLESMRAHGVRVVTVPQSDHFLIMGAPERFNPVLADVVEQLSD